MKLRNKKTGEIVENILEAVNRLDNGKNTFTLAELNAEWEDYEEPKEYWYINDLDGEPMKCELRYCPVRDFYEWIEKRKNIGNYFETKEEAEEALEKFKAWKQLKDAGFMFKGWGWEGGLGNYAILGTKDRDCLPDEIELNRSEDLDLLFGGENE